MDWSRINIWYLLAGLGLFLFGISFLEEAIKAMAGRRFKLFLQKQTGNSIKAVLAGALTTGIMQSSSMMTLLVMSFTGSGIIGLKNGIGMILGANLGSTVTGWIVTLLGFKLNLESFYLPVTAIGSLGYLFVSPGKLHQICKLVFGFGMMFMGLQFMKESFLEFTRSADLSILNGKPLLFFFLFGCLVAAAIRSSAAAMVIFLASLSAGSITLIQAGYLAVGADLGTTITGILGTLNGNHIRKKTGWSQFYINVITSVVTLVLMKPIFHLISLAGIHDPLVSLVTFHSSFNFLGILLILPFLGKFTAWIEKAIGSDTKSNTKFLAFTNPAEFMTSIDALHQETLRFIRQSHEYREYFFDESPQKDPIESYYELKNYENEIFNISTGFMKEKRTDEEIAMIQHYFSAIRSATLAVKDIKDIYHNLTDAARSGHDHEFTIYREIIKMEDKFDTDFHYTLSNVTDPEATEDLIKLIETEYVQLKDLALQLYHKRPDFDLATIFNLIREVRDSRKLLVQAFEHYLQARHFI
jgi:phosphate:Na+ symporter